MNKTVVATVAAVVVIAAAAGGYWMGQLRTPVAPTAQAMAGKGGSQGTAAAANAVTVEAVKVARASLPQTITAVGSLRSDESITVRPEVAGRISAIRFQEGLRVAKGDTLVTLDAAINDAEVQQARANLTLAKSKFDRSVDLAKSNFISGQAKDEAENNLKVAQAALTLTEAKLAKTTIKAPFSGIIGLRSVSVGDYVKEGADIVNLESIDPLKVDFRVPEMYITQVKVGPAAVGDARRDGRADVRGPRARGQPAARRRGPRGRDPRAGAQRRHVAAARHVHARAAGHQGRAERAGLPEQALVPQGEEQYVFKVVDGKAVRQKVEVGQRRDGKAEIVQGVALDDVVVTAGQLKLRDGMPVNVAGAPVNAASAETPSAPGKAPKSDAVSSRPRTARRRRPAEVVGGGEDAAARDLHQATRLRDGALADHPADRADLVHAPVGARVPAHRRAGRLGQHDLPRRVGRGRRVAGHEGPRGLARRHRGRRADDLAEPLGAEPHQRALHAQARSRLGGGRRARQGLARAREASRHDRRAGDREGRGRFAADHLHRGAGRHAVRRSRRPDYVKRYIQPRLSVLPGAADVRIFGERQVSMRINLDRTRLAAYKLTVQDVEDAIRRQNAEIPAGRIESQAREFTVVAETDVRTSDQFNNIIVANVGSYPGPHPRPRQRGDRRGRRARDLALQRQDVAQHRRHQAGGRQPARPVERGARRGRQDERGMPPGMKLIIAYDTSVFIDRSIKSVFETIARRCCWSCW
jgi:membrane fusion protein (multidrug efflux system)